MRWYRWLAVAVCLLAVALPGAARAQVDLVEITFTRVIQRSNNVGTAFTARIGVGGSGITSATVTFPGDTNARILTQDPLGEFVLDLTFGDEAALNMGFADGAYAFEFNGDVSTEVTYTVPSVPSPAISAPEQGSVTAPTNTEFKFSPRPLCTDDDGSTTATLTGPAGVVATEVLTNSADSWVPQDPAGGPLQLDAQTQYRFEVLHEARCPSTLSVGTDEFTLTSVFDHSDQAARPHIRPRLSDVREALISAEGRAHLLPPRRRLALGGPERMLAFVVYDDCVLRRHT